MPFIDYTKNEFKIDQEVVLKFEGNKERYHKGDKNYIVLKIKKIGRKYLTLENKIMISLESGYEKTNYTPNYQMFPSEKEFFEHEKRIENIEKIKSIFNSWSNPSLTNDQLKNIVKIIESNE